MNLNDTDITNCDSIKLSYLNKCEIVLFNGDIEYLFETNNCFAINVSYSEYMGDDEEFSIFEVLDNYGKPTQHFIDISAYELDKNTDHHMIELHGSAVIKLICLNYQFSYVRGTNM